MYLALLGGLFSFLATGFGASLLLASKKIQRLKGLAQFLIGLASLPLLNLITSNLS